MLTLMERLKPKPKIKSEKDKKFPTFSTRLLATLIDTMLILILLTPLFNAIQHHAYSGIDMQKFGAAINHELAYLEKTGDMQTTFVNIMNILNDFNFWEGYITQSLLQVLILAVAYLFFWYKFSATPGKMLFRIRIVDAKTEGKPSFKQDCIRFIGYFVGAAALCLGFVWIIFDKKRQGWHDKMAGTLVIYRQKQKKPQVANEEIFNSTPQSAGP